eukprot:XP_016873122.1 equilibrative nucleoside transporter 2 isoform X4 [Homo sapiens]
MARGDAPRDSYHLVGISFFILGLGTLLPWNFFITAIPYFQARLAGAGNSTARILSTNHTGPEDAFNFNNWVTLLSQLPLLLFTLLNSFLYQCVPETVRILGSLLAILLLFALTAALVKVDMSPGPFFSITMASVCFINSFSAVLQGSLFGQLGTMPSTYSTLFLSGQGLAGIFAALAMLLSMASGVDAETSALGYFITPCVGILMSIVCYLSLPHLKFARYYLANKSSQAQAQELETKAELLQSDENGIPSSPQKVALTLDLDLEKEPESEPDEPQKPGKPSVFTVFQKVWLGYSPQPPSLGKNGAHIDSKVIGSQWVRDTAGPGPKCPAPTWGLGKRVGPWDCPACSHPCLWLPDLADSAVPCVGLHSHPVRLPRHHSHGDQLHQSWEVESVLQPHLLLPPLQHHGLAGTEPDLLLPVETPSAPKGVCGTTSGCSEEPST